MSKLSKRKARQRKNRARKSRRVNELVVAAPPTPPYILYHQTRGVNDSGGRNIPETKPGHRMVDRRVVPGIARFLINDKLRARAGSGVKLTAADITDAVVWANEGAHQLWSVKTRLPGSGNEVSLLETMMADTKSISNGMGTLVARAIGSHWKRIGLVLNPSQSGHPDLIPKSIRDELEARQLRGETIRWSRVDSGTDLKGSCGRINKPELSRPYDAPRVDVLSSITFAAHHNKSRCLIGVLWDHLAGVPQIVAAFFGADFVAGDFTKVGKVGERNTPACTLNRRGQDKLSYACVLNDARYLSAVGRILPNCGL